MTLAHIKVILTSVVSIAAAVSAGVAAFADAAPGGPVVEVALTVGAWLAASIAGLRRVTEVLPQERGILPVEAEAHTELV